MWITTDVIVDYKFVKKTPYIQQQPALTSRVDISLILASAVCLRFFSSDVRSADFQLFDWYSFFTDYTKLQSILADRYAYV